MTARNAIRWLTSIAALGLIGCGGSTPTEPAVAPVAVAPVLVPPVTNDSQPAPATKPPEPAVILPSDTGGKAVAKALVAPPVLPADAPASKPTPYSSVIDRAETPLPPVTLKPFNPTEPKASAAKPSPPAEKQHPPVAEVELPEGRVTDKPRVKAVSPRNPDAADVPPIAWRQGDRAPLEDPTADLSAGNVIATPLPVMTGQLPFLRVSIPDPFEFAEHLKGKLGKEAELGTTPPK